MEIGRSGRRRPAKIAAEIIRAASPGTSKTRIMYGARLNYKQLRRYLDQLTLAGLLHSDAQGAVFAPTEKGKGFLSSYDEMETLAGELRERRKNIDEILPEELRDL